LRSADGTLLMHRLILRALSLVYTRARLAQMIKT